MKRIHKETDLQVRFKFDTFNLDDVANVYFILLDPTGEEVKKSSLHDEFPDFSSDDVIEISENEVDVLVKREDLTDNVKYGKYSFRVGVAYNNPYFEESKEIRSDSFPTFRIVSDVEKTKESDDTIEISFPSPEGGSGGDMYKIVYDPQGINSDAFDRANHTGTQTSATISDFDQAVNDNSAVAANTEKRSYPETDENKLSGIEENATVGADWNENVSNKPTTISEEQATAIETNSQKNSYPQTDEDKLSGIEENATNGADWESNIANKPTTISEDQATAIEANTEKRSYPIGDENKLANIEDGATVGATTGQVAEIAANTTAIALKLEPTGNYVIGQSYNTNQQALDEGYLGYSLEDNNTSRLAPQDLGDEFATFYGTLVEQAVSAKQVIIGLEIDVPATSNYNIVSFRAYLYEGQIYNGYYLITDDNGSRIASLGTFTATYTGWRNISVGNILLKSKSTVQAFLTTKSEAVTTLDTFQALYNYQGASESQVPKAGQCLQYTSGSGSTMKLHYIDGNSTNRTVELQSLTIGDLIRDAGTEWTVQSVTHETNYVTFGVTPTNFGVSGDNVIFTFETLNAGNIKYGLDATYYDDSTLIKGLLGIDIGYESLVPSDDALGFDVVLQEISVSDKWFIQSLPVSGSINTENVVKNSSEVPTTVSGESPSGVSKNVSESLVDLTSTQAQQDIRINNNTQAIANLASADMNVLPPVQDIPTAEQRIDWIPNDPSTDTTLLDYDDDLNYFQVKKAGLRYQLQGLLNVQFLNKGTSIITFRSRLQSDDSLITEYTDTINGEKDEFDKINLGPNFFDNPIDDNGVYITWQCDNANITVISGLTIVLAANVSGSVGTGGDMYKATYDPQAIEADVFARANQTGTQLAETISDFEQAVSEVVTAQDKYIVDPTNIISEGDTILVLGASLCDPAMGWCEILASKLGAEIINKGDGGTNSAHSCNAIYNVANGTPTSLSKADFDIHTAVIFMHALDGDCYNLIEVTIGGTVYTGAQLDGFTATDYETEGIVPFTSANGTPTTGTPAAGLKAVYYDYFSKKYAAMCYDLKNDATSEWSGVKSGRPVQIAFCSAWNSKRPTFNNSLAQYTNKWKVGRVNFADYIGVSYDIYNEATGERDIFLYSDDGTHPLGGQDEYIQKKMAQIGLKAFKRRDAGAAVQIWSGTQAEYDALTNVSDTTLYLITD